LERKLIRKRLDKMLIPLKAYAENAIPGNEWVKTLRKALGMSTKDLANIVGIDQSRISRIENAEVYGNVKISSIERVAVQLGMEFVYGFVPQNTLEDMMREQARNIALEKMKQISHNLQLGLQMITEAEKESLLNDMIDKILFEEPKDFWKRRK
jgi:predicted DNA-binding mobile mystery protein A